MIENYAHSACKAWSYHIELRDLNYMPIGEESEEVDKNNGEIES